MKTGNIIIERCIFTYAETTRSDSDYYVNGNTVRELCLTRSADFILDTAELNLLIHHLCTSTLLHCLIMSYIVYYYMVQLYIILMSVLLVFFFIIVTS